MRRLILLLLAQLNKEDQKYFSIPKTFGSTFLYKVFLDVLTNFNNKVTWPLSEKDLCTLHSPTNLFNMHLPHFFLKFT